jgi:hypothetical protein
MFYPGTYHLVAETNACLYDRAEQPSLGVQRTRTAINAISTERFLMAWNITRIVK